MFLWCFAMQIMVKQWKFSGESHQTIRSKKGNKTINSTKNVILTKQSKLVCLTKFHGLRSICLFLKWCKNNFCTNDFSEVKAVNKFCFDWSFVIQGWLGIRDFFIRVSEPKSLVWILFAQVKFGYKFKTGLE